MPSNSENGSITAELVTVLPAVFVIVSLAIAAIGVQLERLGTVSSASILARAIARGESDSQIKFLEESLGKDLMVEIDESNDLVCVTLSKTFRLPAIEAEILDISEKQCARSVGQ